MTEIKVVDSWAIIVWLLDQLAAIGDDEIRHCGVVPLDWLDS